MIENDVEIRLVRVTASLPVKAPAQERGLWSTTVTVALADLLGREAEGA